MMTHMFRGNLAFNVTALVAAQAIVKLINVVVSIALVRYLGPQELGRYSYVLAFAYPFGALADFGLAAHAIREISRDQTRATDVLAALQRSLLLLAGLGWVAMLALAAAMGHDASMLLCLAVAGFASLVSVFLSPVLVSLTAREDLHLVSLYQVANSLVGSAATVAVLLWGGTTLALLAAAVLVNVVMLAGMYGAVGRPPAAAAVPAAAVRAMVRSALPFGLLLLGFALYYRVDMLMLQWFRGTEEVGQYAAAYRFLDVLVPLAAAIGRPFYPRFSHLAGRDPDAVRTLLDSTWRPLFGFGLAVAVGTYCVAGPLTRLVFGDAFVAAAPLLEILIWGSVPLLLVNIPMQALNAANLVLPLAGVYGIGLAVNVAANVVLIPAWGAEGAALATVGCEWVVLVLVAGMVRKTFALSLSCAGLWRYGASAIMMAAALWAIHGSGLAVQLVVGAAVYAGSLIGFGYLRSADMRAMRLLWSGEQGK
jgi:O-antigen/teichoic acid export membrane protein